MYRIVSKEELAPKIIKFTVKAPEIAEARKPGQFVMVMKDERSERIPTTIVDSNSESGTIDLIIQEVGYSTHILTHQEVGDVFSHVLGPLGHPTQVKNYGTVVGLGGGVGNAVLFPVVQALKEKGNRVIVINGVRTKELVILEEEFREYSDELLITTDDGSYGIKGFGSTVLQRMLEEGSQIDHVIAAGPLNMMKAVAEVTRPYQIPTVASLNAIMLDGTGMCGGCRVNVGGEMKFACVDGPEFDAHLVDFDEQINRHRYYEPEEACQMERVTHGKIPYGSIKK